MFLAHKPGPASTPDGLGRARRDFSALARVHLREPGSQRDGPWDLFQPGREPGLLFTPGTEMGHCD